MLPLQWCLPIFCAVSPWLAWLHLAPLWAWWGHVCQRCPFPWVAPWAPSFARWDVLVPGIHSLAWICPLPRRWANASNAVYVQAQRPLWLPSGPTAPLALLRPWHFLAVGVWSAGPLVPPPAPARCLPAPRPAALCRLLPAPARSPAPHCCKEVYMWQQWCLELGCSFRIWCNPIWCMPCRAVSSAFVQP